ncbi:MAG: alpha/beta fold hydrolase [Blastocatellia bacterium]
MHIERYGKGERAYLGLHGWGGGHKTFAPLVEHLPERARLYAVDLPGYGRSPEPREFTLPAIVDELVCSVSQLEEEKITVIGNCSGAILGLLAARRLPDRIERLILIDPFAFMPWYFKVFVAGNFGRYAYYSTFANPVGRWLTNVSLKRRRSASSDLTRSFSAINHKISQRYLALLAEIKDITQFGNLQMPIDIVYGEKTFSAVKQSVARWKAVWPQSRATELAGAGHLPIEEATKQLSEIVYDLQPVSEHFSTLRDRVEIA